MKGRWWVYEVIDQYAEATGIDLSGLTSAIEAQVSSNPGMEELNLDELDRIEHEPGKWCVYMQQAGGPDLPQTFATLLCTEDSLFGL